MQENKLTMNTPIYDNKFLEAGDLIEIAFEEKDKGKFGTHVPYVAEVRNNPMWLGDLVIWWGGNKMWVYDGEYKSQDKSREVRELRDRIQKVFRKDESGNYVCIWRKINIKEMV